MVWSTGESSGDSLSPPVYQIPELCFTLTFPSLGVITELGASQDHLHQAG